MAQPLALIRGACVCLAGARKRGLSPFPAWQRGQSPFRNGAKRVQPPLPPRPLNRYLGRRPGAVTSQPFRLDE